MEEKAKNILNEVKDKLERTSSLEEVNEMIHNV